MQLKILSWNIWMDGDFEEISRFLSVSNADIIGLQEVAPEDRERGVVGFLKQLGYTSAFSTVFESREDGRNIGNAIFSKFPIKNSRTHILSEEQRRVAVEAEIVFEHSKLEVFSVHTQHTHQKESPVLDLQVENLIKASSKRRVIVMGDFNATPEMRPVKRMQEIFTDTDPNSTPTWSLYPEGCEVCLPQALDTRLDYIFVSKDLKAHSFVVEKEAKGSDHLPISVIVEI